MADVAYDPKVLQQVVNGLYAQARSVLLVGALIGLVLGALGGSTLARLYGGLAQGTGAGAILGVLFGYAAAQSRAFSLRAQAQTLLLQLEIEKNTRPRT
jgi:outer membrane lipoprotein SlyB